MSFLDSLKSLLEDKPSQRIKNIRCFDCQAAYRIEDIEFYCRRNGCPNSMDAKLEEIVEFEGMVNSQNSEESENGKEGEKEPGVIGPIKINHLLPDKKDWNDVSKILEAAKCMICSPGDPNSLIAHCPKGHDVNRRLLNPQSKIIGIVGDPRSGKTAYIAALYHLLREYGIKYHFGVTPFPKDKWETFEGDAYEPLFEKHLLPRKTLTLQIGETPSHFTVELRPSGDPKISWSWGEFAFYDIAGEDLSDKEIVDKELSYVHLNDGIVLLHNLLYSPPFCDYRNEIISMEYEANIETSFDGIVKNVLIEKLTEKWGKKIKDKKMCFVLTKADYLDVIKAKGGKHAKLVDDLITPEERKIIFSNERDINIYKIEKISALCKKIFIRLDLGATLNQFESYFKKENVYCFIVSALGMIPYWGYYGDARVKKIKEDPAPYGIEMPFFILLNDLLGGNFKYFIDMIRTELEGVGRWVTGK